jgi:hypothetical protein
VSFDARSTQDRTDRTGKHRTKEERLTTCVVSRLIHLIKYQSLSCSEKRDKEKRNA